MQQAFRETRPRDLVISAGMVPTKSVPKGLHAKPVLVQEKYKAGDSQHPTETKLAICELYLRVKWIQRLCFAEAKTQCSLCN